MCTIEDELNIDGVKHVLAFVSNEELWRSQKVLSPSAYTTASTGSTLLDLHNSSYETQPHSLIVN